MALTCFIRNRIEPFQEGRRNFAFAQEKRLILREERSFLENVEPP